MSVILLNSDMVHYEVLGRGRPIIFIHGWVGSWRYWIPTMQTCSSSFRTYAVDLFGFGESTKNRFKYTIRDQMTMLNGFMDNMGFMKVALVGHGYGGLLALMFAAENPDLVDRVMAVSMPLDPANLSNRMKTSTPADLSGWLLTRNPLTEPVFIEATKADGLAITTSINGLPEANFAKVWQSLATNCVLVHGEDDPAVTAPSVEQISQMPEVMHSVLFEECGHFPMLDQTNKFNRMVADFLALPSGESPRSLQIKEEWKRRVR